MNKKINSSNKNIAITIISFFMSLVLLLIMIMSLADMTLFNDNNIYSKISGTKYFTQLSDEIYVKCSTIAAKSGINYKAIDSILTSSRIETDMTVYFTSLSNHDSTAGRDSIDSVGLSEELYNSILNFDTDISAQEKRIARSVSSQIAENYKETITLEHFEEYLDFSDNYESTSVYIFIILVVLEIYLVFAVVLLNGKKQKHRLYRRFSVVCGSCGLSVFLLSLFVKISGVFEKMTFYSSEREYNLFMTYFDRFLSFSFVTGVLLILISVVLLILWYYSVTSRVNR